MDTQREGGLGIGGGFESRSCQKLEQLKVRFESERSD